MKPTDVIKALQADNSRLAKEQVLRNAWNSKCFAFFEGARLCYDSLITFGIKKLPKHRVVNTNSKILHKDFIELSVKLSQRELTGHAARDALQEFCDKCTQEEWDLWYSKILIKDLRCGCSETTINKILVEFNQEGTDYFIPVFSCQLAKDSDLHLSKLKNKVIYAELKFDGTRLLTYYNKDTDTITQYTRNGKINENFTEIVNELKPILKKFGDSVFLDGEVISENFQKLMKQVNRKTNIDTSDAIYCVFDIIKADDFIKGMWACSQHSRKNYLRNFFTIFGQSTRIQQVQYETFDLSKNDGRKAYNEFKLKAVEAGLEGIIIKDPDAFYECKRNINWMKYKPAFSVDLKVIGFDEGTGRNKGKLGALVCEGIDQNKFIQVNVGSGLSDEQREEFWKNQTKLINQIVEIEYDMISKSENGDSYSLRFPRFLRFRDDKCDI